MLDNSDDLGHNFPANRRDRDGTSSARACKLGQTSAMTINAQQKQGLTEEHPSSLGQAARTAIAAVASLFVARVFHLPEAYWSAITTVIVMQSTLGAALPISIRRFAGTAVGAGGGALVDVYFPGSALAFGAAVFLTGVVCALLRVERGILRYASITLGIVVLATRGESGWMVALDRFFEVSIGIGVGLAITAAWPESRSEAIATNAPKGSFTGETSRNSERNLPTKPETSL